MASSHRFFESGKDIHCRTIETFVFVRLKERCLNGIAPALLATG
jgi:hypothetical protein